MPAVNRYYSSVAVDTTLSFSITSSALTFEVNSAAGFPTSYPYTLAIGYDLSNEELVTIVGASASVDGRTTLSVGTTVAGGANIAGRGVDSTNDQPHTAGEPVKHVISARDMTEAQAHIASEADAHGISGTFVGTTGAQTLTGKTIDSASNTLTGVVTLTGAQTLTTKTLTNPTITGAVVSSANIVDGTITGSDIAFGTITSSNIVDGTIVNADINASAAIAASKLTGVVTPTSTDTLTNKTLSYPEIKSSDAPGNNVRLGTDALSSSAVGVTSRFHTAVGHRALDDLVTGEYNTAVGAQALIFLASGSNNTAVGYNANAQGTNGQDNTAIGSGALNSATGSNNTAVGSNAGQLITTGSNNTLIGYGASPVTNTASNVITLGNSSIATLRCQTTAITALSDQRDKDEITDISVGLEFVKDLRPVTFKWDTRPQYDADEKVISNANDGKYEGGFIAQELLATENKFNTREWSRIVNDENLDKLEAAPGKLIPILVKAVQELAEQVEVLKAKVTEQESK